MRPGSSICAEQGHICKSLLPRVFAILRITSLWLHCKALSCCQRCHQARGCLKQICKTHHLPLTTHHSPLTTHHSLLASHPSPLTTHHSPLTTLHSPLTTHYSLLATRYSPLATRHSPLGRPNPARRPNARPAFLHADVQRAVCVPAAAMRFHQPGACRRRVLVGKEGAAPRRDPAEAKPHFARLAPEGLQLSHGLLVDLVLRSGEDATQGVEGAAGASKQIETWSGHSGTMPGSCRGEGASNTRASSRGPSPLATSHRSAAVLLNPSRSKRS